jgi:hypothetical protein
MTDLLHYWSDNCTHRRRLSAEQLLTECRRRRLSAGHGCSEEGRVRGRREWSEGESLLLSEVDSAASTLIHTRTTAWRSAEEHLVLRRDRSRRRHMSDAAGGREAHSLRRRRRRQKRCRRRVLIHSEIAHW